MSSFNKVCPICKHILGLNNDLVVISDNIKSISSIGEYDILNFLDTAIGYHYDCYYGESPELNKKTLTDLEREILPTLKVLGEKTTKLQVNKFIHKLTVKLERIPKNHEVISSWFANRIKTSDH